jgi:cystathionine beta-synthase
VRGYKCIFILTDKVSVEKMRYLKSLGADIVVCPAAAKHGTPTITSRPRNESRTKRRARSIPINIIIRQTRRHITRRPARRSGAIPRARSRISFRASAPAARSPERADILKEQNPKIKIIGADPYGSIFKQYKDSGRVPEATPYLVEGIGQSLPVGNADMKTIDEIINITDRESFEFARELSRREGHILRRLDGTNFAAAIKSQKTWTKRRSSFLSCAIRASIT